MEEDGALRFVVDGTAGRLARWLRILGFDVEYVAACEPSIVAGIARRSGRKAITRSAGLLQRLGSDCILLVSERLDDQIRQFLKEAGTETCDLFSRCNVCNAKLERIDKQQVRGRVPEYVYLNHDRFSACPVCGRYYWQGTHWKRMLEEIERITGGQINGAAEGDH